MPKVFRNKEIQDIPLGLLNQPQPSVPRLLPNIDTGNPRIVVSTLSELEAAVKRVATWNSSGDKFTGGTIHMKAGTYNLRRNIEIPSFVTLQGEGRDSTIIDFGSQNFYIGFFGTVGGGNANDPAHVRNVRVRDLTIQKSGASQALWGAYADYFILENVRITNCTGIGFRLDGAQQFYIENCLFDNNGGSGVLLSGVSDYTTASFLFNGCKATDNTAYGFYISGSGSAVVGNGSFVSCESDTNTLSGFNIDTGVEAAITLTGCIANQNDTGFEIDSADVALYGCKADTNDTYGIRITTTQCTVMGSSCNGNGTNDYSFTQRVNFAGNVLQFGSSNIPSDAVSFGTAAVNSIGNIGGSTNTEQRVYQMQNVSGATIAQGAVVVFGFSPGTVDPATSSFPSSGSITSRWKLDESSGNATDSIGSNNLTDNNTVGTSTDAQQGGVSRDFESTTTEYFSLADNASLSITGDLSTAGWVKFESLPSAGNLMCFLAKTDGSNQRSYEFRLNNSAGTYQLQFRSCSDGTAGTQATSTVTWTPSTGVWYHIAAVYDASAGEVDFYVNGSAQGATQTGAATSLFDSTASFSLGANVQGTTQYFDGLMDDWVIYGGVELTSANIATIYGLYSSGSAENDGDEITTTTTAGDDDVFGMMMFSTTSSSYGAVLTEGKTTLLKVDGTTDIAVGDWLTTSTTAGIAQKATTGDMVFAKALEAYTTNDTNGVIDALLVKPRKL